MLRDCALAPSMHIEAQRELPDDLTTLQKYLRKIELKPCIPLCVEGDSRVMSLGLFVHGAESRRGNGYEGLEFLGVMWRVLDASWGGKNGALGGLTLSLETGLR